MEIDPDIHVARTPPAAFYRDAQWFEACRERVFPRAWQLVHEVDAARLSRDEYAVPCRLVGDEPIALIRDAQGALRCLSNVCTHRANLVVERKGSVRGLRCRYHGRRFDLDGKFLSAPGFEGAKEFPRDSDDLAPIPLGTLGPLLFAAAQPDVPFEDWIGPARGRLASLAFDRLVYDPAGDRDYEIKAHWALYVENYLEGFHVPFVHAGLNEALDMSGYVTELHPWSSLQIGPAARPEDAFPGESVAGYYVWLFPTTMLNFYPWGLSANLVLPIERDHTRVLYRRWVWDKSRMASGAGADLDTVEKEDEAIVESVQRGLRSRLYQRGRYAPEREKGVHHFHRLLADVLAG